MTQQDLAFSDVPQSPILDRTRKEIDTRSDQRRIVQSQQLWAMRRGIELEGSQQEKGEKTYTKTLDENLFTPLSPEHRRQFEEADGHELGSKMRCLHSSSCAAVNVLSWWMNTNQTDALCRALRLPAGALRWRFEDRLYILPQTAGSPANIDLTAQYVHIRGLKYLGIECKAQEQCGREHSGLKDKYLSSPSIWETPQGPLTNLRRLAQQLCPEDKSYRLVHASQLLKHALSMAQRVGKAQALVHLSLFDSFEQREELRDLERYFVADGIRFSFTTYPELLWRLAREEWSPRNAPYFQYMTERYGN